MRTKLDKQISLEIYACIFSNDAMGLPLLSPYLQSVGSDFDRHGANFATLASTALLPNTSLFVTGISPFSLAIQLRQMKELSDRAIAAGGTSGKGKNLPPPSVFGDSLYTIDIGQNDFTSNLASQGIEAVKRTLPSVISQISQTIQDLHSTGGARKFMVFNMAPIGCYPAFLVEYSSRSLLPTRTYL
nr:LOW QUALITY PROTEIN: GDSL esterase/lipase At4g01130-like [Aegilops tauschii subsp. strangulata]